MSSLKIAFILLLLTFALQVQPVAAKTKVLLLGDSLSAAYRLKIEQGWAHLLEAKWQQQGKTIEIINASISGETTGGGLARLPALLKQYQPNAVWIELGANDGLRGFSLKMMKNNLQQIIDLSNQAGAEAILFEMVIPPNYGKRYTDKFTGAFSKLAKDNDLALVPFFLSQVALRPDLMMKDGLHPNAEAQPILVKQLDKVLSATLN